MLQTFPNTHKSYGPEGSEQVETEHTYGQKYSHIKGSPGGIQTPARWNLIGDSMAASLCYCPAVFLRYLHLIPRPFAQVKKKLSARLKNARFSILFTLFKNAQVRNCQTLK